MSEELAWAAGLFDGEGSTGAYPKSGRGYVYLRIGMSQYDRRVLDRFVAAVGVGKVYGPYKGTPKETARRKWCVQVTGRAAMTALAALWPWLSPPKREQAQRALRILAADTGPQTLGLQVRPCEPGCACAKHTSWERRERKPPPTIEHRRALARERTRRYRARKRAAEQ